VSDASNNLRRLIALKGPISLAEFMTEALWHPSAGYYARSAVLGPEGDYVTAPEVSQMFGELLGLWAAACWDAMGRPEPLRLIELGPGRGLLMADALRAARVMPGFLEAAQVHLIEASERLAATQQQRLAGSGAHWHRDLATVPEGPTILIASEFLDALPLLQLERTPAGWRERRVDYDDTSSCFRFVLAETPAAAEALLAPVQREAPVGSVVEVSPAAIGIISGVAGRLVEQGGVALFIDYGSTASGFGATLQALRRHARHDPLEAPGCADLTAHVDFAALVRAAREAGAATLGPIEQGIFLTRLGIRERAELLMRSATADEGATIAGGLRRLIEPEEMGTLFKVMALAHPRSPTLPGFEE
jgi:NADH dehydrogenase [ubiquinone] 1 alpha subcomplex assembly factor 7